MLKFFKKEAPMPAIKKKSFHFTAFDFPYRNGKGKNVLEAAECLNLALSEGKLGVKFGLEMYCGLAPNVQAAGIYCFSADAGDEVLFYSDVSGKIYRLVTLSNGVRLGQTLLGDNAFTSLPRAVAFTAAEGAKKLFFYTPEKSCGYDGTQLVETDVGGAKCACAYYDRLFFLSSEHENRVYFSAPLSEGEWRSHLRGAGYVDFDPAEGEIVDLCPVGKKLYILRKGRVSVLQVDMQSRFFIATPVLIAERQPYANTAQAYGNKMLFLGAGGLYAFNGYKTVRLAEGVAEKIPKDVTVLGSGVYGGRYFLSYTDGDGARTALIDPDEETGYFISYSLAASGTDGKRILLPVSGGIGQLNETGAALGTPLEKRWRSRVTDFGLGERTKSIGAVVLRGNGAMILEIEADHAREKRVFSLTLRAGVEARVPVRLKGRSFVFSLVSSAADFSLESITVLADVYGEG